jgi:hypothetical protein
MHLNSDITKQAADSNCTRRSLNKNSLSMKFVLVFYFVLAINAQSLGQSNTLPGSVDAKIDDLLFVIDSLAHERYTSALYKAHFAPYSCYCSVPPEICVLAPEFTIYPFRYVYQLFSLYDTMTIADCSYFVNTKDAMPLVFANYSAKKLFSQFKAISKAIKRWQIVYERNGFEYGVANKIDPLYYCKQYKLLPRGVAR